MILIDLPKRMLDDLQIYAEMQDVDVDSFILWAVAEKVGELKYKLIENQLKPPVKARPNPTVNPKDEYI